MRSSSPSQMTVFAILVVTLGCGESSAHHRGGHTPSPVQATAGGAVEMAAAEPDSLGDYEPGDWEAPAAAMEPQGVAMDEGAPAARSAPRMAQAQPRTRTQAQTGQPAATTDQTATDAVDTSGPLLVYTATFHLAVHEVEDTTQTVLGAIRELGGHIVQQSDNHLVVRVPARRFREALAQIEGAGDVLSRDVRAQDVGEEFRDLEIRIRNAEAMRERLEQLLQRAQTVAEALAIEQQMQRITDQIERMKGRLRFLADRVAYSTITIHFRPQPTESIGQPDVFRLPFDWLNQLGLSNLLSL